MTTTVDAGTRARAAQGLETSMALSAGAGSGKTSVLSARIVETLLSGVPPTAVAGLTFTEKAAGELLRRVRERLEQRLREAVAVGDAAMQATVSAVLGRFADLTITTIHSCCRDLLRHEAFAADFAPATDIGDDGEAWRLAKGAVEHWRRGLRSQAPSLWRVLDELTQTESLVGAVLAIERHRDYDVVGDATPFDLDVMRQELSHVGTALRAASASCTAPDTCKLLQGSAAIVDAIGAAIDPARTADATARREAILDALLNDLKGPPGNVGKKGDWTGTGRDDFRAALDDFWQWRRRWRGAAHGAVMRALRDDVATPLTADKRDVGLASFDDLLVIAASVLRTDDDARARLAARYRVVLIDEVQDTDPIQAEVALALTRAAGPQAGPSPGALFAVGDPRQSIYRFRGADVATWQRLEAAIAQGGERHALVANFRSAPGIVQWVNHTFADLPGYEPQVAQRSPSTSSSSIDPVVLLQVGDDGGDEVDALIGHLQTLQASGAQVHDPHTGALRPVRGRDVMVLLPSWGKADGIADRLRSAGHACVVEGGGAFFDRDEVRLLVTAARVIAEPADTRATAFVLRGLFGLSLQELATHVVAGGALRCTLPPTQAGPVSDALGLLLTLHRRRGTRSLSSLLQTLLSQTRALCAWALLADGASRSGNVDKLLSIVRDLEQTERSPLSVADELDRLARDRKGDKDIDRLDDDGDAIRVTTLFKAKGLEAPVVFLMHASRKVDGVDEIVDHAARSLVVKAGALVPADWEERWEHEKLHILEERRRWMYVAATRARDQLVLCRAPSSAKASPSAKDTSLLSPDIARRGLPPAGAVPAHDTVWHPDGTTAVSVRVRHGEALPAPPVSTATFPGVDAAVTALLAAPPGPGDVEGDDWARADRSQTKAAERGCVRWRSATDEGARAAAAVVGVSLSTGPEAGVVVVGSMASSARVGKVVHEVMERLDLTLDTPLQKAAALALVPDLSRRAGLDDVEVGKAGRIVDEILNNPKLQAARQAPELWREVPFTFPAGARGFVAGTIDLCFPLDVARRRWVIFDWKSSVPPRGSPKRARYETQLEQYAKALLHTFGDVEIVDKAIVGPFPELGPTTTPDDVVQDAAPAFREGLAALLAKGAPLPLCDTDLELDLPATAALAFLEDKIAVDVEADDDTRAALLARGWRLCADLDEVAALLSLSVDDDVVEGPDAVEPAPGAVG